MMQQHKGVKDPGKQRKMHFNAPAHIRHKRMGAQLSKTLAAQKGVRTMPVRKGDTVRIERGDNKGFEGKVSRVDLKAYRIYLEGLTREKVDGTNIFLAVHPSKVQIRTLSLDDNWRKNIILPRKKTVEKPEKKEKQKAAQKKAGKKAEKAKALAKGEAKIEEEKSIEKAFEEEAPPETVKEETPAEKAPAKKAAAKKTTTKKSAKPEAAAEKGAEENKPEAKPRAKRKAPEKTKGGQ
jgi:large subunit ribosomal protein L24